MPSEFNTRERYCRISRPTVTLLSQVREAGKSPQLGTWGHVFRRSHDPAPDDQLCDNSG